MKPPRFCAMCAAPLEAVTLEEDGGPRQRLRCPACGFTHYGNPTPVVAALVEHEGAVVLVQNKGWPSSWFGLVSGFLEAEERPEDACLREVREELGVEGRIEGWIGAYAFPMRNEVILAWHVCITEAPVVGPELAAIKRVPIDKLRPWPMGTGEAVRDWLARRALPR